MTGSTTAWLLVLVAGFVEIGFAIALKASDGFSRLGPSALTLILGLASLGILSLGLKVLPVGQAYAVWTAIGTAGTALAGMALLGEPRSFGRIAAIAVILGGVVALQLTGTE